jgi:heptosyltransferase-3
MLAGTLRKHKSIKMLARFLRIVLTDLAFTISFTGNAFLLLYLWLRNRFSKEDIVLISLTEHIGDLVAAEPVSRYLRKQHAAARIYWVVDKKYRSLIECNPNIDRTITVSCFAEWIFLRHFARVGNAYDLHINHKLCDKYGFLLTKANPYQITLENYYNKGNLLYCFSRAGALDMPSEIAPRLYFPCATCPPPCLGKYIVFHTLANTNDRCWTSVGWNQLTEFILNQYAELVIIEIGLASTITSSNRRYQNYCGQKALSEVANLIKDSTLFMGVESGFAHFANALAKEAVILIGRQNNFQRYMPYSGKYWKERDANIVYFDGELKEMPFDFIRERIFQKLALIR